MFTKRDHPASRRARFGAFGLIALMIVLLLPMLSGAAGIARPAHAAVSAATTDTATATATSTVADTATATKAPSATSTTIATATATTAPSATPTVVVNLSLSVAPTSVAAGDNITLSGSGYQANEAIQIELAAGTSGATINLTSIHANASGAFSGATVAVPISAPAGSYQVLAVGLTSQRTKGAALTVTVPKATLSVAPTTFTPNDTIQVSGTNFQPGESVAIVLSSTSGTASIPLGQATVGANGQFTNVSLHVPFGVPAGSFAIVATGRTSSRQVSVPVTVHVAAATLAVTPTSAKPGDSLSVTGTHFQPGETVTVDLVALSTSTRVGSAQVATNGTFTITGVKVPLNTPQGTVSLVATGTTSHLSASATLTVGALPATVTLGSGTVTAGHSVSLTASGFVPGETVLVQLTGGKLAPVTLVAAVVGTGGTVHIGTLVIPSFIPAGGYQILVTGQTSARSARATLTVQAPPAAKPILSLVGAPQISGAYVGTPAGLLQVAGSNFPANSTITIVLAGASSSVTLGSVRSNASGGISPTGLTVPGNVPAGAYTLEAQLGGKSLATISLRLFALSPHLTLSSTSLTPGQTITVRGTGFAAGEQVVLALNGAALVTSPTSVLANSSGAFSTTVKVPGTLNSGLNTITASGATSRASVSVNVTGTLPVTSTFYFPHGDTTSNHRTVIAVVNPNDVPATVKLTFLYQDAPERGYSQTVPAHAQAGIDLALAAGSGRYVSTILQSDRRVGAQSIITYGAGDSSSAPGATAPGTTWYLAEGYTGGSFNEYLTIMNPNTTFATVDVRFLPFNGRPPVEARFVVRPRSNIRVNAGQYVPNASISTIVTSDRGVVVERSMRFGAAKRGAHDKIGVLTSSTIWQFAEGESSATRQTFLTILNPNQAAPAAVTATFFDRAGRPIGQKTIIVDPLRRGNIKLNDVLSVAQVATIVTSNVPVVVERPLYEGTANLSTVPSGSVIFGRNGGGVSWTFPAGSTLGGTTTRLYLFNPNLKASQVTMTFYTSTGAVHSQSLIVAADSVSVVNAADFAGAADFGVVVRTTNGTPFIAELSQLNAARGQASSTQGLAQ